MSHFIQKKTQKGSDKVPLRDNTFGPKAYTDRQFWLKGYLQIFIFLDNCVFELSQSRTNTQKDFQLTFCPKYDRNLQYLFRSHILHFVFVHLVLSWGGGITKTDFQLIDLVKKKRFSRRHTNFYHLECFALKLSRLNVFFFDRFGRKVYTVVLFWFKCIYTVLCICLLSFCIIEFTQT